MWHQNERSSLEKFCRSLIYDRIIFSSQNLYDYVRQSRLTRSAKYLLSFDRGQVSLL